MSWTSAEIPRPSHHAPPPDPRPSDPLPRELHQRPVIRRLRGDPPPKTPGDVSRGQDTRKDIATRFGRAPEVARTRPAKGWEAEQDWWIRSYATKAEQRIHRKIPKLERYFGTDGLFSLCYCWFYYDSRGRLIDAEWQWSSD
ncbi:hypothetical protein [Luteolibacter sp. Populi]|uniref:hypothetical protein n=1 Tax=Luteolibacter sp. Populi TaxID=3230487 RepID=UPI003467B48A